MTNWRSSKVLGAAVAFMALGLTAACGGGGASDARAESQGVTGSTVKIGTISDRSGPTVANQKPWLDGFSAVIDRANEDGGIAGRKIELINEDDKYDSAAGLTAYKKLVAQTPVVAIAGISSGDVQTTIVPLVDKDKIPVVGGLTTTNAALQPFKDYFFATAPNYGDQVDVMLGYGKKLVAKDNPKVVVIDNGSDTGVEVASLAKERSGNGYDVVEELVLKPTDTTADAVVQKLIAAKPDYAIFHGSSSGVNLVLKAQEKFGATIPVIGISPSGTPSSYAGVSDATAALFSFVQGVTPSSVEEPGTADLVAAAKAAGVEEEAGDPAFVSGYVAGLVMVAALEKAGKDLDRASLKDALESLSSIDTQGLTGPLGFGDDKRAGLSVLRPLTWDPATKTYKAVGAFSDYESMLSHEYTK